MKTVIVRALIAAAAVVCLVGCASTRFYPGVLSPPPPNGVQDNLTCLNFVRSSGWVGGGSPVAIMLMSTGSVQATDHLFCFLKKGVRMPSSKNGFMVDNSLGYRVSLNSAKYRASSNVVITVPSKVHEQMLLIGAQAAQDAHSYSLPYGGMPGGQNYDMALISLGIAVATIIADEASRVELTLPRGEFERVYCDRVLYGKAIGCLGPGGRLSYRTPPGEYVVQAWADYYKFQGYAEWSKRAKSAAISLQAKTGQSYTIKFTPHLLRTPTSIDATCVEDR